jgi:hypothetical protein
MEIFACCRDYNWNWSSGIIKTDATAPWAKTMQRIAKYAIIPFLLVVFFEALVKNLIVITTVKLVTWICRSLESCSSEKPPAPTPIGLPPALHPVPNPATRGSVPPPAPVPAPPGSPLPPAAAAPPPVSTAAPLPPAGPPAASALVPQPRRTRPPAHRRAITHLPPGTRPVAVPGSALRRQSHRPPALLPPPPSTAGSGDVIELDTSQLQHVSHPPEQIDPAKIGFGVTAGVGVAAVVGTIGATVPAAMAASAYGLWRAINGHARDDFNYLTSFFYSPVQKDENPRH